MNFKQFNIIAILGGFGAIACILGFVTTLLSIGFFTHDKNLFIFFVGLFGILLMLIGANLIYYIQIYYGKTINKENG